MFPHIRRQFMAEAQSRLEAIEEEERKMLQGADAGISYEMSKASVQDWYKRSSRMSRARTTSTLSRVSRQQTMGLSDYAKDFSNRQSLRRGTTMNR